MLKRLISLVLAATSACGPAPTQTQVEGSPRAAVLTSPEFKSLLEAAVTRLADITERDFANQESIPLQVEGYAGKIPTELFGKPVIRTDNYLKAAEADAPSTTSLFLSLIERGDDGFRVHAGQSWGTGGSEGEAWFDYDGVMWTTSNVLWQIHKL